MSSGGIQDGRRARGRNRAILAAPSSKKRRFLRSAIFYCLVTQCSHSLPENWVELPGEHL
jgi:hypothetical protein